ncbi:hypothetical protein [Sphaerotilus uruguayifluvii]|uniref:Transmembrane protein n=1 Tax=Sphaerotilus uruguayifluvii TaxID=2735897 RepID=A0ABX2G675_9BURK|nr:hypothetical protein [Leptothrix sp. C29]NRT57840.1 hypothetical protein [Leptothrix sp. C29]
MDMLKRLPGSVRAAPGLEWALWRRLPAMLLWGTLLPALIVLARHLLADGGTTVQIERELMVWTYQMIGVVVLHWSLVLTLALGCFIVRVMKGPAYVADAYEMEELDPEPSALPLPLSGR